MITDRICMKSRDYQPPKPYRIYSVECNNHHIRCIVTANPRIVERWLTISLLYHLKILHKLVIGLGVQWCPYSQDAAIMQLCIGHHCLIFKFSRVASLPSTIRRFLENPNFTFVCGEPHMVSNILWRSRHRLFVSRMVDIRDVAEDMGRFEPLTPKWRLANWLLGVRCPRIRRGSSRSRWSDYYLNQEQVNYACVDAFVSFSLGLKFRAWNWIEKKSLIFVPCTSFVDPSAILSRDCRF